MTKYKFETVDLIVNAFLLCFASFICGFVFYEAFLK